MSRLTTKKASLPHLRIY